MIGPPVRIASRVGRMLVIRMGDCVSERKSWCNMHVVLLSGAAQLDVDDTKLFLRKGTVYALPPHVEHSIRAISDARVVVTFDASGVEADGVSLLQT